MKINCRSAYTLVEILVVILLMAMVSIPLFNAFRTGMKMSLKGLLKAETTLEARRILKQVQIDLQQVTFPLDGTEVSFTPESLVKAIGAPPTTAYTFLAFPCQGKVETLFTIEPEGVVWRNASEITYSLVQGRNSMYSLIRSERFRHSHPLANSFPGGVRSQTLSDSVNYFSIVPVPFNTPTRASLTFRVHLQLVDSVNKAELSQVLPGAPVALRIRNAAIADFFTVVNPHFYNRLLNRSWFNPNWQTAIHGP